MNGSTPFSFFNSWYNWTPLLSLISFTKTIISACWIPFSGYYFEYSVVCKWQFKTLINLASYLPRFLPRFLVDGCYKPILSGCMDSNQPCFYQEVMTFAGPRVGLLYDPGCTTCLLFPVRFSTMVYWNNSGLVISNYHCSTSLSFHIRVSSTYRDPAHSYVRTWEKEDIVYVYSWIVTSPQPSNICL